MADRTVSVRFRAVVGPYQAAMAKATKDTREFKQSISSMSKEGDKDFRTLSAGMLVAGGAMALGFGKMIGTAASFEKEMSGVHAVSGASAEQMRALSDAALAAGASQKLAGVTAADAAKAEAELVRAGVSVSDILGGGLMGSLTLASAGQLDFAKAAEIAAQAMNIFDLKGSQVTHVADVLAAAANKSAADVAQLGDGLRQGGLVAAQTGLSLEETAGALAAFADNALVGSDAGTSLKTMLQRLTPQSVEAKELMEQLGFSAYDAGGNFIGLSGLADELQDSLGDMTVEQRNSAMATLFGSDAVRAANILYAEGAKGIEDYVAAVNDQGAAARMAAIQNDNLQGDIEALGGAIESAMIQNGSKATGALRGLTQTATAAVNGFSALPEPVQATAMGLGAVATAGTAAIGALGTLGPKVTEARASLEKMGAAGQFLNRNLGRVAGGMAALGAGMAIWGAWETMMAKARAEADKLNDTWRGQAMAHAADGLRSFKSELDAVRGSQKMLNDAAGEWWEAQPWDYDVRGSYQQGAENLDALGSEMERLIKLAEEVAGAFNISGDAALEFVMDQQAAGIDVLASDYERVATEMKDTFRTSTRGTMAAKTLAEGMEVLGSETASVEEQVKAFKDSLDALFDRMFGVESATDAFQSTLNELPELLKSAKEEGLNLADALTSQSDEAIGVREHMRGMISDASALIAEWQEQGVAGDDLANRVALLSLSFRQQAIDAGLPGPVVDHYLELLRRIPVEKNTTLNAKVQGAELAEFVLGNLARTRVVQLQAQVSGARTSGLQVYAGGVKGATGGLVPEYKALGGPILQKGYGPRGTDTVPAWLTPGEFVMQTSAVNRLGTGLLSALNDGRLTPAPAGSSSFDYGRLASAVSGGGRLANVTVNYPKAERTSDGLIRAARKAQLALEG